jgi:CBS domain-containing protein
MEIANWVNETKAREIMVEILVTLSPTDTLSVAADTLLTEQISGAPVLDADNRCVGVLAISDLIRAEELVLAEQQQIAESSFFSSGFAWPERVYAERLEQLRDKIKPISDQPIERFMTRDLISVRSNEPLATVLRDIIDAHVHRVLVLDEDRQVQGIISTIDVLAALQRASS